MAVLNVLLQLQCIVLVFLHWSTAQECLYEYTSHPMINLTCNPYGSSLHLRCAVTGPLYLPFHIQWYLTLEDQGMGTRLGTENDTYHVDSNVLDEVGNVETQVRSISSVLATGPLSEETHQNHCITCLVEFGGVGISLGNNGTKLCLTSAASYAMLPSCSNDFVVQNSTAFCATSLELTDFPQPTASLSYTSSSQQSMTPTDTEPSSSHPMSAPPPHHPMATGVAPPPDHPVATGVAPQPVTSSAAVNFSSGNSTPSTNTTPSTSSSSSQAAVEGGLFVAIGICVTFVVVIIILMYFVVRLCREWPWNRGKKQDENEDADAATAPPNPAVALARGYSVERFQMDSESLFLDEDTIFTAHSLQDLSHIEAVPPIPPRPWKDKMVKSNSASALNSRGLLSQGSASTSLSPGYNNFTFPEDRPEGHTEDPDVPPPIPVRSKSRDHFYHTLECPENVDSGVASACSPVLSQQRSNPSSSSTSSQADQVHESEQLFDDPRYVALQVEGVLRDRKEIWRSTPALASINTVRRGGSERRSLRLTHVVGTEMYNY